MSNIKEETHIERALKELFYDMRSLKNESLLKGGSRRFVSIAMGIFEQYCDNPSIATPSPPPREQAAPSVAQANTLRWIESLTKLKGDEPYFTNGMLRSDAREALAALSQLSQAEPVGAPVSGYQPTEGEKLWLWKNGDHFLAFRHLYPCFEPGGDPMTLGEPVGYAVFKGSHDRSEPRPSNPPVAAPHFMSEAAVQQRATQREHARIDGMVGALKRIQEERKGESE